jgi:hypothetical protein
MNWLLRLMRLSVSENRPTFASSSGASTSSAGRAAWVCTGILRTAAIWPTALFAAGKQVRVLQFFAGRLHYYFDAGFKQIFRVGQLKSGLSAAEHFGEKQADFSLMVLKVSSKRWRSTLLIFRMALLRSSIDLTRSSC